MCNLNMVTTDRNSFPITIGSLATQAGEFVFYDENNAKKVQNAHLPPLKLSSIARGGKDEKTPCGPRASQKYFLARPHKNRIYGWKTKKNHQTIYLEYIYKYGLYIPRGWPYNNEGRGGLYEVGQAEYIIYIIYMYPT